MADNAHSGDNPLVLADEIVLFNGVGTTPDSSGKRPLAQTFKLVVGGDGVARFVSLTDPVPVDPVAQGTWEYRAGPALPVDPSGESVTEQITGRVLSIDVLTGSAGGTVTINGGAVIPIPADVAWGITIRGLLVDPTVAFTGVVLYVIEVAA